MLELRQLDAGAGVAWVSAGRWTAYTGTGLSLGMVGG